MTPSAMPRPPRSSKRRSPPIRSTRRLVRAGGGAPAAGPVRPGHRAYRRYTELCRGEPDPYYGLGLCLRRPAQSGRARGAQALRRDRSRRAPALGRAREQRDRRAVGGDSGTAPGRQPAAAADPPPPAGETGADVAREPRVRRGPVAARPRPHRRGDHQVPAGDRRRPALRRRARRWASCCSRSAATTRPSRCSGRPSRRTPPIRWPGTTWRSRCAPGAGRPTRSTPTSTTSSSTRPIQTPTTASDARFSSWVAP